MVRYLLDTNVVSEATKERAEPVVSRWLSRIAPDDAFISVVTVAELRAGAELMPMGARRRRFEQWIEREVHIRFQSNTVEVDLGVADAFGVFLAEDRKKGRTTSPLDLLIAATASARTLVVVTRNTRDFEHLDIDLVNPSKD